MVFDPAGGETLARSWGAFSAGRHYPMMAHGVHIPVVEVEPATGRLRFRRYVAVHDVGSIVNPKSLRGPIAGGITQDPARHPTLP